MKQPLDSLPVAWLTVRERGSRLLSAVLLVLAVLALVGATGCGVQEHVLNETSAITARITVPLPLSAVGVRVNLVGSGTIYNRVQTLGPFPNSQDLGFCSVLGDFTIQTTQLDRHFIVARGTAFDIGYGIVNIPDHGQTITQFETNIDSARFAPNDPRLTNSLSELIPKTASSAVFVVFAEDFGPLSSVSVVGDFNSFDPVNGAIPLFDDGSQFDIDPNTPGIQTSGDRVAGDGVWTRTLINDSRLQPFSGSSDGMKYGFVINNDGIIRRDPYEETNAARVPGAPLVSVILIK